MAETGFSLDLTVKKARAPRRVEPEGVSVPISEPQYLQLEQTVTEILIAACNRIPNHKPVNDIHQVVPANNTFEGADGKKVTLIARPGSLVVTPRPAGHHDQYVVKRRDDGIMITMINPSSTGMKYENWTVHFDLARTASNKLLIGGASPGPRWEETPLRPSGIGNIRISHYVDGDTVSFEIPKKPLTDNSLLYANPDRMSFDKARNCLETMRTAFVPQHNPQFPPLQ